ncbi:MAG: hypothetical protein RSA73_02515 [Anaerovoracaceae bacterium]
MKKKINKENRKDFIQDQRGISLIIVVIIMLVFFIIGGAVMTSASGSLATVNGKSEAKQTYYLAKSSLKVVNKAMTEGALGKYLRNQVYSDLVASGQTMRNKDWNLTPKVILTGPGLEGVTIQDGTLTAKSQCSAVRGSEGVQSATLLITEIKFKFTVKNGTDTYKLTSAYTYEGSRLAAGWGSETWNIENVSQ